MSIIRSVFFMLGRIIFLFFEFFENNLVARFKKWYTKYDLVY